MGTTDTFRPAPHGRDWNEEDRRREMSEQTNAMSIKVHKEILKAWADWWNGPGRECYQGMVLPPLTKTAELLSGCMACRNDMPEGEVCMCCGRIG